MKKNNRTLKKRYNKNKKKEKHMKKILTGLLLITSTIFANSFQEQVESSYKEIEKILPITIDTNTIWTKAEVKENVVEYTFVLNKTDLDFTPEVVKVIETQLCENPTAKTLLSHDYSNKIFYKDLKDNLLKEITITKKTCGYDN